MIRTFSDKETELIWNGVQSKQFPSEIQNVARRKLRMISAATSIEDLYIPPGNHLEKLIGRQHGKYSIRINSQWKIVFDWKNGGAENVRITDYH